MQTTHKNLVTYDEFKEIFGNISEIIVFHGSLGLAMRQLRTLTGEVDQVGSVMLGVVSDLLEFSWMCVCSFLLNTFTFG